MFGIPKVNKNQAISIKPPIQTTRVTRSTTALLDAKKNQNQINTTSNRVSLPTTRSSCSFRGLRQPTTSSSLALRTRYLTNPGLSSSSKKHPQSQEKKNLERKNIKGKGLFTNKINKMISPEQLAEILATVRDTLKPPDAPPNPGKSFSKCSTRFNGERKELDHFVNTVLVFKDSENIAEDVALKSFPLLLTGEAGVWWQGIRHTVATFDEAIKLFRSNYEIVKKPHQIYLEIFMTCQGEMKTDSFICNKRALFSKLPAGQLSEEIQLDMIYGLLSLPIRSKISRDDFQTFDQLITKSRHVESLFLEEPKITPIKKEFQNTNKTQKYCRYCHIKGHDLSECRKRMKTQSPTTSIPAQNSNQSHSRSENLPEIKTENKAPIRCYGCNEPGVIKSNCKNCNKQTSAFAADLTSNNVTLGISLEDELSNTLDSLAFSSLSSTIAPHPRPQVMIKILGENGMALLDTAAKSCIASDSLSSVFRKKGVEFNSVDLPVSLADGSVKVLESNIFNVNVTLEDKVIPTTFISFPNGNVKQSLLGIDFIKNSNLILNFSNSKWTISGRNDWYDMIFENTPHKSVEVFSVQMLRDNEGSNLTPNEKDKVNELLEAHSAIFKLGGAPTSRAEHRIVLDNPNMIPIAVPPYRMSAEKQRILKTEIDKMLLENVIEECESPWAAPVVLIPKPDKSFRVCIDYRKLNAHTISDKFPMPQIDDLLHLAKETMFMSVIDLKSGYWQVPVAEQDRDKTAFVTPFGLYRFKRMPFGLKNAPATFQRLINRFKTGLPQIVILCYLDDIIVISQTFENHLTDLKQVFYHLASYNLIANREKCNFFKDEVKYLGHVITYYGIKVNPGKVSAINDMPAPKNVRHLKGFLQTCSWYRKFVPNFSEISRPLSELTRKSSKWTWTNVHSIAFQNLKDLLTSAPILKQVDENLPFVLRTDASNYALGAVLLQREGSDERPIEYASRLLTTAERNYNTTEREALAVVWALQKFRGYIDGAEVEVITDHQALKWLMSIRIPSGRLARWVLLIQSFNITISYTPGKSNVVADMLSRPICTDIATCGICSIEIDLPSKGSKVIRDSQLDDPEVYKIMNCFENPHSNEVSNWLDRGYLMENGILYRLHPDSDSDEPQLVVPAQSRAQIMKLFHDDASSGHIGIEATIKKISNKYYWVGMRKFITDYIKACPECQKYKISNQKPSGLLKTPVLSQRGEVLAIDLFGPLVETSEGYNHILVVEDVATKWTELYALKQASAENCAKMLISEWFMRFGLPRRIISDNGTQFVSQVMQHVADHFHIHQNLIPKYHPEANPVERRNRDIKTRLAILVKENHNNWSNFLPAIRFSLNSTCSESTGYSPAFLNFGRELRNISDIMYDTRPIVSEENFIPQVTPYLNRLNEVFKNAKETNEIKQDKWKHYADKKRSEHTFKIGDLVLVKTQILSNKQKRVSSKFTPKRDGPYRIKEFKSSVSCEIETLQNVYIGTYHVSHLTHYIGDPNLEIANPVRPRGRPHKVNPTNATNIDQNSSAPQIEFNLSDEECTGFQGFSDSDIHNP